MEEGEEGRFGGGCSMRLLRGENCGGGRVGWTNAFWTSLPYSLAAGGRLGGGRGDKPPEGRL